MLATKNSKLRFFKETGFFDETKLAIKQLSDMDDILLSEGMDYYFRHR